MDHGNGDQGSYLTRTRSSAWPLRSTFARGCVSRIESAEQSEVRVKCNTSEQSVYSPVIKLHRF